MKTVDQRYTFDSIFDLHDAIKIQTGVKQRFRMKHLKHNYDRSK